MPDIDWDKLDFQYVRTKSNLRHTWENGEWSEGRLTSEQTLNLHIAATCLHYGQACFEGLKAFKRRDGKVHIFRPWENAKRMANSSKRLLGPDIPEKLFVDSVVKVVADNIEYVPPYGSGGALYIRPLLIGVAPTIGIAPSTKYELIILVTPVGPYYKSGVKPVDALIMDEYDRASPLGTGGVKIGANYAASLVPSKIAQERGFSINLFLDAKEHKYVEEFGTSNFIGITQNGAYVTPESPSVLPSITNKSLITLAKDLGIEVERRPVPIEELSNFVEVGACGTAVIITPIRKLVRDDKTWFYGDECGPTLKKLYDEMTGIQFGDIEDRHGWTFEI
jgi:branched-chain amino acid aminotransferase